MRPAGLLRHPHGRPRTIPGARLWCSLVALMALISPARAHPFAQHIVPSATGRTAILGRGIAHSRLASGKASDLGRPLIQAHTKR